MVPTKRPADGGEGLAAWLTLLQARSVVVDALEADLEIPLPWVEVLVQLSSAPEGRLPMQELAHSVLLSKSGLTRLFDRMEKAGLVKRLPCPSDRRITWAAVTPQGRAALRRAMPVLNRSLERSFSSLLTTAELNTLRATLGKVLDAAGFAPTPCPTQIPA
jgi:DNA-binding MarR family transcriptional regulator